MELSGTKIQVSQADQAMRLDRWLGKRYPQFSAVQIQRLIRRGEIRVDSSRAKPSLKLESGQMIRLPPQLLAQPAAHPDALNNGRHCDDPAQMRLDAARLRSMILARRRHYSIINKPAGLASQGGTGIGQNLADLCRCLGQIEQSAFHLVHRLDKETSGIMMLAHGRGAAAMFSTALAARQIHKTYLAVICNSPPKRASMIDQRLVHERKDGRIQHQPAQTRYQLLARAPSHKASIVLLQPVSGRKHQLRRHLQGLGCPIIGDRRYGSRQQEPFPVKRLALHAWRLELPDALLGAGETFTAQPDQAFLALVKQLIPGDELMEMLHRTT